MARSRVYPEPMESTTQHVTAGARQRRSSWSRRLGTLLVVAGLAVLGWTLVVWQWNDPFTSLYTRWEQRSLETELARVEERQPARPALPPTASPQARVQAVAADAKRFRAAAKEGAPIGRIVVPRLGVNMVMVEGTETDTLKKGPGRHPTTWMPGEGKLAYVAGHRTTYGAPFAHIDALERGDRVTLEMPYATFVYEVTESRIVDDQDLSVLESRGREELALQACHPRFFATQRYVVWAEPVTVTPTGGTAIPINR